MEQKGGYEKLIVWQKAFALAEIIYRITGQFPAEEKFGLVSQIRRASVSIPSNIAEGRGRGTRKDFIQFLRIAYGSTNEVETQLLLAFRLSFLGKEDYNQAISLLAEVRKMLAGMMSSLKAGS